MATLLLPEGIAAEDARRLMDDLVRAARAHDVALVGGHTEITVGLDRPLAIGCLLGTVPRDRVVRTSGARVGDAVILTAGIAIEGTAILAEEHAPALRARGVAPELIAAAVRLRHVPGIAVRRPAEMLLQEETAVHAMHDPTEGGVVTALHEMAEAAQVGLAIDRAAIPIYPECRSICDALDLDPLGLLASGALLAAVDPAAADRALARLRRGGVDAARYRLDRGLRRRRNLRGLTAPPRHCLSSNATNWRAIWSRSSSRRATISVAEPRRIREGR